VREVVKKVPEKKKGPETLGFRPFTGHDFRLEGTGDYLSLTARE